MATLVLDASGPRASVACLRDGRCLADGAAGMRQRDREALLPLVLDVLARAEVALPTLHRVVVGDGPGAFTSLRIAAATAKGLVHGTGIALAVVPSLVLLAASATDAGDRRLAVSDALRGERFVQPVALGPAGWAPLTDVTIVPSAAVPDWAARWQATVVGPAEAPATEPAAAALLRVDPAVVRPVSLADWEPRYGRLAEAQVKWEAAAGHPLPTSVGTLHVGTTAP